MTATKSCVRKILTLSITFLMALSMVLTLVPVSALAAPDSDDVWLDRYTVSYNVKKAIKVELTFKRAEKGPASGDMYINLTSENFYITDKYYDASSGHINQGSEHAVTYVKFNFAENTDEAKVTVHLAAWKSVSLGGTQTVGMQLSYVGKTATGEDSPKQLAFNVLINMADEPTPPESQPEQSKPETVLTPHVVITGYDWGDAELKAGNELYLTVSFRNTSKTKTIQNIMISITLPGGVILAKASSSFYMEKLEPGQVGSQVFWLKTDKKLESGIANFSVSFNYEYYLNEAYSSGSDSESFGLIFEGAGESKEEYKDRFEITDVALPDYITVGEEGYITVKFVNKGKESLNNVSVKLECDGMQNTGVNDYFGMLNANVKNEMELPVVFSEGGNFNGVATVSYELPDGTFKEVTRDFSVFVEEAYTPDYPDLPDNPPEPDNPQKQGLPFWAIVAIIAGGVAVVVVAIVLLAKHARKKKLVIEDEEDENS